MLTEDIAKALAEHALWVNSHGSEGLQADFGGANLRDVDLAGTDLRRAQLRDADFSRVDLSAADLREADLGGASLSFANLREADLRGADLRDANLSRSVLADTDLRGADLRDAVLSHADLYDASLRGADLTGADLRHTDLGDTDLTRANLSGANLREASLRSADLRDANLSGADLRGACLEQAVLVRADLRGADLSGAGVHGVSAWDLKSDGATRWRDLVLMPPWQPVLTTDDLELAQLICLLAYGRKTRTVLEAVTSRVVLILGSSEAGSKPAVEAVKEALREQAAAYVPVVLDLGPPSGRGALETLACLAPIARFAIGELSFAGASGLRPELVEILQRAAVPLAPVVCQAFGDGGTPRVAGARQRQPSLVLPTFGYRDIRHLTAALDRKVIAPVEAKVRGMRRIRA